MPERHDLVLCADDFGLAADIDAGILALIEQGRLSATGCMVAGPTFAVDAARLASYSDRVDIGLHFALTDLPSLGDIPCLSAPGGAPPSLDTVLRRSFMGGLDYDQIKAEIGRQVGRFREVMGRSPDFVDGHQHVHCFPGIRSALMSLFRDGTLDPARTWIRDCHENVFSILGLGISVPKALFISGLSFGLAGEAARCGVATNNGFRGITGFTEKPAYSTLFPRFIDGVRSGALVMCHPASPDVAPDPTDPIAAARRREYAYFCGAAFPADLERAGVRLARMSVLREAALQAKARA